MIKSWSTKNLLLSSVAISSLFFSLHGDSLVKTNRINDLNITSLVSVFNLDTYSKPQLLQDNVESFQEKIRLIRNSKYSLDLMYYIYSTDESSSYLSQELIKAANRGVKIRVLVDYITNYKNMDTFIAIQNAVKKGKGSIEFRFYGRPTANVIRDVIFMTTTCDQNLLHEQCVQFKIDEANKYISVDAFNKVKGYEYDRAKFIKDARNANSGLSGVLLSGLYGKSGNTLKYMFHQLGYDKKLAAVAGSKEKMTAEDKESAKKLAKLYIETKKGDVPEKLHAKFLLTIATLFYGEKISKILNFLEEALPIDLTPLDQATRMKDWDYLTDYLHHKLLLADSSYGYEMVLGGRNIENSYHMQQNPSGKYTFVDTDITMAMNGQSGMKVKETFNRLWNFDTMVAPLNEVLLHAPNDTMAALSQCPTLDMACFTTIPQNAEAIKVARETRYAKAMTTLNKSAKTYLDLKTKVNTPTTIALDKSIDKESRISYIENLPFNKNNPKLVRNYGSEVDREELSGKYIHKIWVNSMLDLCGPEKGKQTIYFRSAYVVFPTPLLSAIAELTKAASPSNPLNSLGYRQRDCSNVTIKILTNSVETTDLSIINVFARVQLHALFKTLEEVKQDPSYQEQNLAAKAAHLEYYEYLPKQNSAGGSLSLHSKLSIIGNNAIIGSANADVRSYMMDSNNGVYIENAPHFVKQYSQFLESEIKNPAVLHRLDTKWRIGALSPDKNYLGNELNALIKQIQDILKDRKWAKEKYFDTFKTLFSSLFMEKIIINTVKASTTYTNILPGEFNEVQQQNPNTPAEELTKSQEELRQDKNNIDRLLKLF